MSSSSDRTKLFSSKIPDLNGTNYREWADAVKAFARYNGVWFLIEGYGTTATTQVVGMALGFRGGARAKRARPDVEASKADAK